MRKPRDLFDDPHLNALGGLVDVALPTGGRAKALILPATIGGRRLGLRADPPAVGADTITLLHEANFNGVEIDDLLARKLIG